MILMFGGIENSLISRRANKRVSNLSLLGSLLPNKYLLSLNINWPFEGEIIIFAKFDIYKKLKNSHYTSLFSILSNSLENKFDQILYHKMYSIQLIVN